MMRARNRHSASNYLFAAFLELVIMGLFVIIAQPQLRESLFELLEPSAQTIAAPTRSPADATTAVHADIPIDADRSAIGHLSSGNPNRLASAGQQPGWSMTTAGYSPFEQFESFAFSSSGAALPASIAGATGAPSEAHRRVAGYAPAAEATQLNAIDWNIASTGRPLSPHNGSSYSVWPQNVGSQSLRPSGGWTASRPAEADYRDTYPPPYGTQSQWK